MAFDGPVWPFPNQNLQKAFLGKSGHGYEPPFTLNTKTDTRYAHNDPDFSQVLHVFCKTWLGLRAAAGSLPGNKMAFDENAVLDARNKAEFLSVLTKLDVQRIVIHGLFPCAVDLIDMMARAGASDIVHLVYHGNLAQWVEPVERARAIRVIEEAEAGRIKRVHFMQRNYPLAGKRSYVPMMINPAPFHADPVRSDRRQMSTVFIPGTDTWRKNLHVNAYGAAASENVTRVLHYAPDIKLPKQLQRKLSLSTYLDRGATFSLMARVGCTLGVSLVECHPMVGLESESVGTPCLRGRLNLDHGEDHAYVRLVQVDDPLNPFDIRDRLDALLGMDLNERTEIIDDYTVMMNRVSINRYKEFLSL